MNARFPLPALLFALLALPASAQATLFTYGFDSNDTTFSGTDGWESAYCSDPWTTALNGGVCPKTDDGCIIADCTANYNCQYEFTYYANCQDSDPFDNHLKFGSPTWQDVIFTARFRNADDDTVGFVFRYVNSANFYLFFMSRDQAPSNTLPCSQTLSGARLWRIANGNVTQLATSATTYSKNTIHKVRISAVGSGIQVQFDANANGSFEGSELLFSVTDNGGPATGRVGFYAYENGSAGSECAGGSCWFDDLEVDVLSTGEDKCNGISYEGQCNGNQLLYCSNGNLEGLNCGGCCAWDSQNGYYNCLSGPACNGCANECQADSISCSQALTHSLTCAQVDNDPCLDLVQTPCTDTGICDPATGQCLAACAPSCAGKECGSDGCGGSCGECPAGHVCSGGQCTCVPSCAGKECGPDGCGGSCGTCVGNALCTNGTCQCSPDCAGKQCGPDGCGGSCGACPIGTLCNDAGQCGCVPQCAGKECGADGCGGTCGDCNPNEVCTAGLCICTPDCTNKQCGPDGCGGTCGVCPGGTVCNKQGLCECVPQCGGLECGDDGCGGSCGDCQVGKTCVAGQCVCTPACDGTDCGPDGCGGVCGICAANEICQDGLCVCVPDCAGKECGPDGCAALCGECTDGLSCDDAGQCVPGPCEPDCDGKECGFDGCNGLCGECTDGQECVEDQCQDPVCEPKCLDKECGPDGCGGSCGECPDQTLCDGGSCVCLPDCQDKQCGDDGCGGLCGECDPGHYCQNGLCKKNGCVPDCTDRECGNDGCGGVCGVCDADFTCTMDGQCVPSSECTPKAAMECIGDAVYWLDSCGNPGELLANCEFGCQDGACLTEPQVDVPDVLLEEELLTESDSLAGASAAGGETVVLGSGKSKSGGCSAADHPTGGALLLILLLLATLPALRRRAPLPSPTTHPLET